MIQGLIFDMDGVLLDTEKIYFQCWKESAQSFGYTLPDEVTLAVRSCCQAYAEPYFKRCMGEDFDYLAVRNKRRMLVSEYIAKHGIQQKPGILSLISFCHEHGIATAIATATSRSLAEERLTLAGLPRTFTQIVGGDEVSYGKPSPEIYQKASAKLHLAPKECVAIEDSPNGIFSAFAAGCQIIMVPDLTQPDPLFQPILSGIAKDLAKVIPILAAMIK